MTGIAQQRTAQAPAPTAPDTGASVEQMRAQLMESDPRFRALNQAIGDFRSDTLHTVSDRKNGAYSNFEQSSKAVEDAGFWLGVTGGRAALERTQRADFSMYQTLQQKEQELTKAATGSETARETFLNLEIQGRLQNAQADKLAAAGQVAEANAMRQKAQLSYNQAHLAFQQGMATLQVTGAVDTHSYMSELRGANEDLATVDTRLKYTGIAIAAAPVVVAVAGATIAATAVAAGTMTLAGGVAITAEMGVVGSAVTGVVAGTAVATIGSLPGHLVQAAGDVYYGNIKGNEAGGQILSQVGRDIRLSGTASVSAVTGLGATKLLSPGTTAMTQGFVNAGVQGFTNSTLNTGIDVTTGARQLNGATAVGVVQDTFVSSLTGGLGGKLGAVRQTMGGVGGAGILATETIANLSIGLASAEVRAKIEGRELTGEEFTQEISNSIAGGVSGELAARRMTQHVTVEEPLHHPALEPAPVTRPVSDAVTPPVEGASGPTPVVPTSEPTAPAAAVVVPAAVVAPVVTPPVVRPPVSEATVARAAPVVNAPVPAPVAPEAPVARTANRLPPTGESPVAPPLESAVTPPTGAASANPETAAGGAATTPPPVTAEKPTKVKVASTPAEPVAEGAAPTTPPAETPSTPNPAPPTTPKTKGTGLIGAAQEFGLADPGAKRIPNFTAGELEYRYQQALIEAQKSGKPDALARVEESHRLLEAHFASRGDSPRVSRSAQIAQAAEGLGLNLDSGSIPSKAQINEAVSRSLVGKTPEEQIAIRAKGKFLAQYESAQLDSLPNPRKSNKLSLEQSLSDAWANAAITEPRQQRLGAARSLGLAAAESTEIPPYTAGELEFRYKKALWTAQESKNPGAVTEVEGSYRLLASAEQGVRVRRTPLPTQIAQAGELLDLDFTGGKVPTKRAIDEAVTIAVRGKTVEEQVEIRGAARFLKQFENAEVQSVKMPKRRGLDLERAVSGAWQTLTDDINARQSLGFSQDPARVRSEYQARAEAALRNPSLDRAETMAKLDYIRETYLLNQTGRESLGQRTAAFRRKYDAFERMGIEIKDPLSEPIFTPEQLQRRYQARVDQFRREGPSGKVRSVSDIEDSYDFLLHAETGKLSRPPDRSGELPIRVRDFIPLFGREGDWWHPSIYPPIPMTTLRAVKRGVRYAGMLSREGDINPSSIRARTEEHPIRPSSRTPSTKDLATERTDARAKLGYGDNEPLGRLESLEAHAAKAKAAIRDQKRKISKADLNEELAEIDRAASRLKPFAGMSRNEQRMELGLLTAKAIIKDVVSPVPLLLAFGLAHTPWLEESDNQYVQGGVTLAHSFLDNFSSKNWATIPILYNIVPMGQAVYQYGKEMVGMKELPSWGKAMDELTEGGKSFMQRDIRDAGDPNAYSDDPPMSSLVPGGTPAPRTPAPATPVVPQQPAPPPTRAPAIEPVKEYDPAAKLFGANALSLPGAVASTGQTEASRRLGELQFPQVSAEIRRLRQTDRGRV